RPRPPLLRAARGRPNRPLGGRRQGHGLRAPGSPFVRLDPLEVPYLPLPCALLDRMGQPIAQTPEWRGAGPGSLSFGAGQAQLVVGPTEAVPDGQQTLTTRLLRELDAAVGVMTGDQALCASVLASSLELVAGQPIDLNRARGSTTQVLEYARATIAARTSGVRLDV